MFVNDGKAGKVACAEKLRGSERLATFFLIVYLFFMHSYTSVNLAPRVTAGHLRALSVPGVEH